MFSIDSGGWLEPAAHCPSPNFGERPPNTVIDLLVIHNISLPAGEFGNGNIRDLFCNCLNCDAHPSFADLSDLRVSSHLLIDRAGAVTQFVGFGERAWHAGVSEYQGKTNCNDFSIGVELEGTDTIPYTLEQYQALVQVTRTLQHRYPHISSQRIVGHCDIAPGRKTDPGPAFDWHYYKKELG